MCYTLFSIFSTLTTSNLCRSGVAVIKMFVKIFLEIDYTKRRSRVDGITLILFFFFYLNGVHGTIKKHLQYMN